jgi:N-methylhydantoinase A
LGWLNPEFFVGGKFHLNAAAAARAIRQHIAEPLGLETIEAAHGIIKIVSSGMVEALRLVTVSRGEDPREYVLVAFGGAGPVHAALLAQELKIPRVIVPASPGVHSAMGLLVSDLKRDSIQTHFADLESVDVGEIERRFEVMEKIAQQEFESQGIAPEQIVHERAIDLRYSIQKYELPVPVSRSGLTPDTIAIWRNAFDEIHEKHFGSRAEDQKVELVNYRLTTKVIMPKPAIVQRPIQSANSERAIKARRRAYFDGWSEIPVYDREKLMSGNRLSGPAIIEQMDSTTVVHPGQEAHIDRFGNIIIEINWSRP